MVSRSIPFEYFSLDNVHFDGHIVAYIDDQPIQDAVVDARGRRYRFVGLAQRDGCGRLDVTALRRGEWIVLPNLIYSAERNH